MVSFLVQENAWNDEKVVAYFEGLRGRLANVFGGGDMELTRLVPDAARALAAGERPVIRSDGTPRRTSTRSPSR